MIPAEYITLDFESKPIGSRPNYPPEPVGFSSKWPGQRSRYWSWGHPTGNNCTYNEAMDELERIWNSGLPILCHNAKFDIAVACEKLGAPMPPWERIHDTQFLAFLADPHSRKLGLKELCEDLLQWPPEEKDRLAEWIMSHSEGLLAAYPWNREWDKKNNCPKNTRKITVSKIGMWIFAAPGDIVGPYACGDTDRTAALFDFLAPLIEENGMWGAYNRERELMPILMDNEREGMRLDLERIEGDIVAFAGDFKTAENWLRKKLQAPSVNFDADQELANILLDRGIVPAENWVSTDSGALAMNKDDLRPEHFTGPDGADIASVLGYRNRLKTCMSMFMQPWARQARENRGYITTNWNQTRGGASGGGTRTGRPSTDKHNFLNISKDFESKRDDGFVHPEWLGVAHLPLCRKYILPDAGQTFLHRDFAGQEMRVFAHFEQGDLWRQFNDNPHLDPHEFIGNELMRVAGREIDRTRVKTLNFQGLYGGGIPALQAKLRCTHQEAKELKKFHDGALPGRVILNDEIKRIVGHGNPIRTVGGRLYYPEPPKFIKERGRTQDFTYKLINYEIQGSAADLTKQAIIDWHNHTKRDARFLITVYDEVNLSADDKVGQMAVLKEVMEAPRLGLTVPMLSDGKMGHTWGDLTKCA